MTIAEKTQQITALAEQIAANSGFVLVDVRLLQQGKRRTVEVTIHKLGGRVSLDDCEEISRQLEKLLDEQSPPILEGPFVLEVQSPGIDRQLKTEREFRVFAGQKVEVKTKERVEGLGDSFEAVLVALSEGRVSFKHAVSTASQKRRAAKPIQPSPEPTEELSLELNKLISVRLKPQLQPAQPALELDAQDFLFDLNGTDN